MKQVILALTISILSTFSVLADSSKHFNRLYKLSCYVKDKRVRRALKREIEILRKKVLTAEVQDISLSPRGEYKNVRN